MANKLCTTAELRADLRLRYEEMRPNIGDHAWIVWQNDGPERDWYVLSDAPDNGGHSVALCAFPEVAAYLAALRNAAQALLNDADALDVVRAEAARLTAVIAWYADPANWRPEWMGPPPAAWQDHGERARAALAEQGNEERT